MSAERTATVRITRLGNGEEVKKLTRPEPDTVIVATSGAPSEREVAVIVSAAVRNVKAALKERRFDLEMSTPNGQQWSVVHWKLYDADTRAMLGHGLVLVHDEHGHPWQLNPYRYTETKGNTA